jgi:pimeloyl-ACP methyl ester carboxylesterase
MLALQQCHLLGHGTGAAVAIAAAAAAAAGAQQTRVLSLTLASPLLAGPQQGYTDALLKKYAQQEVPVCLTEALQSSSSSGSSSTSSIQQPSYAQTASQALNAVNVPVLITYGARDAWFSKAAADQLGSSFAVTKVAAFGSSGHLPHLDEREEYLSTLLPFLQSADSAAA